MRRAVFLDRDDTLIANASLPWEAMGVARGDLCDPERVELLPGVREACRALADAGHLLVVVTNQGLVARGVGTLDDVERTNQRMIELLSEGWVSSAGGPIAGVYVCPYHPKGTVAPFNVEHPWRKPSPGMVLQAARDLEIDLTRSWLVGDAERDVACGRAAGIPAERCLRVGGVVGGGREFAGLLDAARRILAE